MGDHQRADARRNYARILAAAEQEVGVHGAGASLEQIARTAGVGSATVRRHFPTRRALLEAVSRERIETLCVRARDLAGVDDSREALLAWLADLLAYSVTARGLAAALSYDDAEVAGSDPVASSCAVLMETAAGPLVRRAVRDGAVASDVTVSDLIALVVGVVLATEHRAHPAAQAERLFQLAVTGLSPAR
ncbi:TetR/AcrR family transcriptional regulator [Pseudonocardia lutea]|uniref:TetR/AcrR family transcriptional regulator n=1 Tax=Pseudonocardia lutea TaxID=2172015 RepID=A0ABW1IH89_9PSEU